MMLQLASKRLVVWEGADGRAILLYSAPCANAFLCIVTVSPERQRTVAEYHLKFKCGFASQRMNSKMSNPSGCLVQAKSAAEMGRSCRFQVPSRPIHWKRA